MKKRISARIISVIIALIIALCAFSGCGQTADAAGKKSSRQPETVQETKEAAKGVYEEGEYSTKDEVAEYIHLFEHLPSNYITKDEAKKLGWQSNKGNLWDVAPGKSIGGDRFGNREGSLPEAKNRKYFECDINYEGGFRGSDRIIYSNDGLIYYTEDHYESFDLLYGEE